jgi:predicted membrane protein
MPVNVRTFYRKLLTLYPQRFKERLGESMEQTFNDLYEERQTKPGRFRFVLWTFIDTTVGIFREHMLLITEGATMKNLRANPRSAALISSILLALAFIVAPLIYLVGNLRDAMGPFAYSLADFLYGPVWAAALVTLVFTLRERIGEYAPRRMSLALLAAALAAGLFVAVACIRSANRHYHMIHPELHLETSSTVLIVWTTLVAGVSGAGWHFLGWAFVLVGSAGWTSGRLPRLLSVLYLVAGITSLFVYLLPDNEGLAGMLGVVVAIWQGILLWKAKSEEKQGPEIGESRPDQP